MIVFAVTGWSGAGKTRLMTRLIATFNSRGLRVLAAKHAGHGASLQPEGKDSGAYLEAGAETAAVLSGIELLQIRRYGDADAAADELRGQWAAYDVVLLEGRAYLDVPFVEVLAPDSPGIRAPRERLAAVVTDQDGDYPGPRFSWDEVDKLAEFMEEYNGLSGLS